MSEERIGIVMNGITGRMGRNQHLARSIMAIREQGGVVLDDGRMLMPEPLLVGRNEEKLKGLSEAHGGLKFTTDLDAALGDPDYSVYFDSQTTNRRYESVKLAIDAGKHIYCEKPSAASVTDAMALYDLAEKAGVRHGVVQDKLWLPGLRKLQHLIDTGFFGEILSVRGEFGYWVFSEKQDSLQRPSWNYRSEDGGGLIVDMLCHWRYVIDNLFGSVTAGSCLGAT
ncbi:MAG: Gfo/Idh/MocA family oxidoreductase, partial [Candidatus Hydrogenedentota bacterium]